MVGDGKYLSTGEVVEELRAAGYDDSESTVRRLIDAGVLKAYRTETGGHRRVLATSVADLLRRRAAGEADTAP